MSRSLVVKNKEKVKEANILAVVFDFDDTLVCPPIEWQQVMAEFFVDNINENYVSIVKREEQVARYKKYIANNAGLTLTKYMVKLQQLIQKKRRYGVRTVVYYREKFDELWRSETVNYYTPKDLVMGVRSLLLQLMKNGIKIFVVTGGDRAHKVNLIKKLNLEKIIRSENIFGDYDERFPHGFSKKSALQHIRDEVAKKNALNIRSEKSIICMIGDGKSDMQAAQKVGNVLAVGFHQKQYADMYIMGKGYPVNALVKILVKRN